MGMFRRISNGRNTAALTLLATFSSAQGTRGQHGSPTQMVGGTIEPSREGPVFDGRQRLLGTSALTGVTGDWNGDSIVDLGLGVTEGVLLLLNDGGGRILHSTLTSTSSSPSALLAVDVDSDGDLDLVALIGGNASVFRNDGLGGLSSPEDLFLCTGFSSIASADVEGDGDRDLGFTCGSINLAGILGNQGDGSFALGTTYGTGNRPRGLALADMDADGAPDMVVANDLSSSASVRWNDGTGSFATLQSVPAGGNQRFVALGDLDGDLRVDIAVSNSTSGKISVLGNLGGRAFAGAVSAVTGGLPSGLQLHDFSEDGAPDIVCNDPGLARVLLRRNEGSLAFSSTTVHPGGSQWAAAEDFDEDGSSDVLAASGLSGSYCLLPGEGPGVHRSATSYSGVGSLPISACLADVNGDQDLDLVVVDFGLAPPGTLTVLLGSGDGTLTPHQSLALPFTASGVAASDLDQDGDLDLAITVQNDDTFLTLGNSGNGLFSGWGTFAAGDAPWAIEAHDFDSDGDQDLVMTNLGFPNKLALARNGGSGTFASPLLFAVGADPRSMAVADVESDGDLDVVVASNTGTTLSLLRNVAGTFITTPALQAGGSLVQAVALEDLDGDGHPDMLYSCAGVGAGLYVRFGRSSIGFDPPVPIDESAGSIALGDLDGDATLDILLGLGTSTLKVLRNRGSYFSQSTYAAQPGTRAVLLGDLNEDDRMDAVTINADSATALVHLNRLPR